MLHISYINIILAPLIESELTFLTRTFLINYDVINRKPDLLLTRSTIRKRAKRMPDATVETTLTRVNNNILHFKITLHQC